LRGSSRTPFNEVYAGNREFCNAGPSGIGRELTEHCGF